MGASESGADRSSYRFRFRRFLQLRKMEAARDIAGLVANSNNKLMLDSESLLLDCAFPSFLSFRSRAGATLT